MSETIPTPTDAQYAAFGKWVAASMGSASDWSGGDICEMVSEAAGRILRYKIGSPDAMPFWREKAAALGIDFDDEDVCADESCFASLDDGEGADGFCGQHADERYCENCEEMFADRDDRDGHTCED